MGVGVRSRAFVWNQGSRRLLLSLFMETELTAPNRLIAVPVGTLLKRGDCNCVDVQVCLLRSLVPSSERRYSFGFAVRYPAFSRLVNIAMCTE